MIVKECKFSPERDIKAVVQFGFINRKESFATGIVPTVLPDSDVAYNGIENPAAILGKPEDVFDALHMQSAMNDYSPEGDSDKDA